LPRGFVLEAQFGLVGQLAIRLALLDRRRIEQVGS
jgi:hypothetical protein